MSRRRLSAGIFLLTTLPAFAAGGVHKWIDENGEVVYSQFAPPQSRQSELVKPPPPPAESPEVAQKRLQEQIQRSADFREDKELAASEAAKQQAEAERTKTRCEQARSNLAGLEGRARQLFRMPDGSVQRLSAEQREAKRAEAQKAIDENCR